MIVPASLVSVIVPVYGVERYLDRCVASIVNQTYRNLEIILVDDGSKDRCPFLCDIWAKKDSRIVVMHKTNGGIASARNAGMDVVSGEYVMFIDSDDYIEPDMIETMVYTAISGDAQMAICGNRNLRYNNGKYTEINFNTFELPITSSNSEVREHFLELATSAYCIPSWNTIYNRAFLEENNARYDEAFEVGEDTLFNIPLYLNVERLTCIPQPLYNYVSRDGSLCNHFKTTWFRDRSLLFQRVKPLLEQWGNEYVNPFANEFIYQTGVILSFLYEDDSAETRALRASAIREIAQDRIVAQTLHDFTPTSYRNMFTAKILGTHCPAVLATYGRIIAFLKRLRSGRK